MLTESVNKLCKVASEITDNNKWERVFSLSVQHAELTYEYKSTGPIDILIGFLELLTDRKGYILVGIEGNQDIVRYVTVKHLSEDVEEAVKLMIMYINTAVTRVLQQKNAKNQKK